MAGPTSGSLYWPFLDVTELYIHGNIHIEFYRNAASLQSINGWIESLIDKWSEIENVHHKDLSWQEEREGRWWWEVDKAKTRDLIPRANIKHEQDLPDELKHHVNGVADPRGCSSNQILVVSTRIGIENTALLSRPLLFLYTFWSHSFQAVEESYVAVIIFGEKHLLGIVVKLMGKSKLSCHMQRATCTMNPPWRHSSTACSSSDFLSDPYQTSRRRVPKLIEMQSVVY